MIKMQWVVTSDLSKITLDEFDNEWNGMIFGFWELSINNIKAGIWPSEAEMNKLVEMEMADMEDILYWLVHLKEGIYMVKRYKEYEMLLFTMNRYKLKMGLEQKLDLQFINRITNEVKWNEKVELKEFEDELYGNIERFLDYIKKVNSKLLKSEWIKRLLI